MSDNFNIDDWLDEIEPPRRTYTVNTRGDLLGRHGELGKLRDDALQELHNLAARVPDGNEPAETIGSDSYARLRAEHDAARSRVAELDAEIADLERRYAANRVTFTFRAIDPRRRAELTATEPGGDVAATLHEQTLRLFLASVVSITVHRDGTETTTTAGQWTTGRLSKFLARIGEGQTEGLLEAYISLGMDTGSVLNAPAG